MAIDKKLICFARLEEFERQLAAGNILDKSIVFIQDANKIYNRGTYYDCQSPYVLPFDIETLDGLSYSDNEGRLQTDADVFEKAKSAIEMGRMVVIRYGLSDAGYHICDATYNGDAISVRVYNGLMLYSFEIYASSQGSIVVEQYSLQSELVDGVNIATINGQSLTAGGDITIEGGAKVYTWIWDGSESGTLTQDEMDAIASAEVISIISTSSLAIISTEFKTDFFNYLSLATLIDETGVYKVLFSFNPDSLEWQAIKYNLGLDTSEAYPITIIGQNEDGGMQCAEGTFSDIVNNGILKMSIHGDRFYLVLEQTDELIVVSETYFFSYDNEIKDQGYIVLRITSDDIVYEQGAIEFAKLSDIPTKTSQLENDSNFVTSEDVAAVALSGSYNDLQDTPTIPAAVTESTVSGWGFTKNTGTITGVSANGTSVATSGVANIPAASTSKYGVTKLSSATNSTSTTLAATASAVKAAYDLANGKQDKLVSGTNIKTINGESIVGSGDITIQGGGVSSYTTNFTYRELYEVAFSEGQSIECNVQLIEDALRNNIPVFVPIDTDPSYYGYAVLEGYAEDLLYFSVKTANEIIGVEISRTASEIRSEDINKKGVIATVEESVSKERIGELDVANTHALFGGGSVYALPDTATGDEDDILLSKNTVKTINGESILGSGDIEIGGGGGGVYITPFTVDQFCTGSVELTDEQRNELLNAASQNRIIGMLCRNNDGTGYNNVGYIVADFEYITFEDDPSFWRLVLGVIYDGAHYSNSIASDSNSDFGFPRLTITSFKPLVYTVTVEDGVAELWDNLSYPDNCIFWVGGECTELYINLEPSEIGKTVRFFTGESCMLEFAVPAYWANGEVPTIEPYTHYELSLVTNMEGAFNAVLTPFKPVE